MQKRILIVEDNFIIAEDIKSLLESFGYFVVAIVDKAENALAILKTETVNLILIDIVIKGELSGIDLAEIVTANYTIPFVYLTSNSDKATIEKAIIHKPKAYIVKPFNELDIFTNIRLALSEEKETNAKKTSNFFMIKVSGRFVKIAIDDFLFAKADGNYLEITTPKKSYLTRMNFRELLTSAVSERFFKIHKSYVINLANVISFSTESVILQNHSLPLGRVYREPFILHMKKQTD